MGRKLVLRQQGFEVARKVRAAGEKLDVILLLRVSDRAAAQKSCPDVRADACLAANQSGVYLQARLGAGGASSCIRATCSGARMLNS